MSETQSSAASIDGAAVSDETAPSAFDEIGKSLESEGFTATSEDAEAENPDDNPDDIEESDEPKVKLKVNGKIIEKTQKEVVELAQKYSATELKLETAKKEITEARAVKAKYTEQSDAIKQLMGVMKAGDVDTMHDFVAEQLGGSDQFNKGVIDYVLKLWEHSKMSPEQKEHVENKKQLVKLRQQEQDRQKADSDRAFDYEVNQWSQHIELEVPKALKEVGLPDSEFVRGHIISTWRAAIERGQNPTAAAVANHVKTQLEASKLLPGNSPTKVPPMPAQRPRATAETVGRRTAPTETGYGNWDDWKRTRGH